MKKCSGMERVGSREMMANASFRASFNRAKSRKKLATRKSGSPDCWVPSSSPGPRDGQILFGYLEPVGSLFHHPEALSGFFRPGVLGDQQTLGRVPASPDPAAELVELREAKPFGVFYDHDRSIGNVNPHFDDDGRNENMDAPGLEIGHDRFFLLALHPAVNQTYFEFRENIPLQVFGHLGGILEVETLGFFNQRVYYVGLLSLANLFPKGSVDAESFFFAE